MAKVGRKTKMTELTVKKLEEAFALDTSDEKACYYAGISRQTLNTYQNAHPEFLDRKHELKARPILKAKANLLNALNGKDPKGQDIDFKTVVETSKWYLERKCADEFAIRVKNDINAKGINIQVADKKTKDALEDL